MIDLIESIARKTISEKKPVVLYGAGFDAMLILHELTKENFPLPVCICDSDKSKWHTFLMGIEILSIDEALYRYPNLYIFISTVFFRHQIIGQLLMSGKISQHQILNYDPVEKRKSCVYVESQIIAGEHKLFFCCSNLGMKHSPFVQFNNNYTDSIDAFLQLRDKLIYNYNHSIPTTCDGCPYLFESYFPADKKIRLVNYSEGGICNLKCCYCRSEAKTNQTENTDIELTNLLSELKKRNLLAEDLHSSIACGEISIHSRRETIYESLKDNYNFIFSNSAVYDEKLADMIKNKKGILETSVDSGTPETYKKIKGVDLFEKVRTNLYRYANENGKGSVELKYIFLPGLNDNEADIDGFIELCKYVMPYSVAISHNFDFVGDLPQQTIKMVEMLMHSLEENRFFYKINSDKITKALNEGAHYVKSNILHTGL